MLRFTEEIPPFIDPDAQHEWNYFLADPIFLLFLRKPSCDPLMDASRYAKTRSIANDAIQNRQCVAVCSVDADGTDQSWCC
jgi:hypothetical protein